ncbi:TRAPP II complex [Lyophyllum atratum]|nr:TRAPP II complex [Lyophyllum atratum]
MDTHAFASLAHVRVLLIPVGTISRSSFEKYAADIRSFDSVRLGDIPADHKDERARFMPSPLSTGYLHLSFPTHPPPRSHLPLSLIRPSHFPLAVIGVAVCSKTDSLSSVYAQFNSSLIDIFPSDGIYPLAKNCFIFEESDDTNLNLGDNLPGLVVLPSMMGNKKLYIGTLLADLCSQILGEFGIVVQALESPLGNEYLNSTLLPIIPPLSELPEPLNGSKRDSLPPLPSHNSQPDMGKANFTLSAAPMKRTSSGPGFRQSTVNSQPARKRLSSIGAASSHARLFKVLGDLFLLAGRPEDAIVWYLEALQLFKSSQDHAWHAATLEGLATVSVIEAWSAGNGLQNSTTGSREPWTEVSDRLTQATALYYKSPTSEGEPNHSLLSYLYTCCVLRHASLLFATWSAKGWGPLAFTTMLQPGPKPYLPPTLSRDETSWANLERLSSISGISRSSIASILSQSHGPWLLHLGARERIAILEAISSLYACLGYRRKEAYILREVLGCILDLMVCGREEDGLSRMSSVPGTSGLGIQGLNSSGGGWSGVGVRMSESSDGNESILALLKYVCKVLGINLDAVKLVEADFDNDQNSLDTRETPTLSYEGYDNEAAIGSEEPYGWPELQVGVVREAVAVAEALPDFPAVAQFALSALKTLQTVLSPGDQYHLYSTSSRALITARRRGDAKSVEYWSGRPVVSITIAPMPLVRLPVEKPISALRSTSSGVAPILTGGTDPFLYNPRKAAVGQGRTLVVQSEILEFVVILQNPYIFDLELQSLSLSTAGVSFESRPLRVLIPANSFHEVVLSGRALETGTLTIRGCRVQAPGGAFREFIMPLSTDEEEQRLSRTRSSLACEAGRFKYSGIESFPWERANRRASRPPSTTAKTSFRFLECKVVPEQPLLRIRRTSLTHGALMLYNGEMSTIRITLENVSPLPIDFLRLVFDDSTIAPAQQALAEGELSVFDTYETEYSLIQRPVFSWNKEEAKIIQPGQKLSLTVTCIGKVGCTNGTLHFSYSYVHRERPILDDTTEVFHTRQISYPVMVTVYHMLECHGLDILPFPRYTPNAHDAADNEVRARRKTLYVDDEGSWCLFSIEVRNTYGLPFDVIFERLQEGAPPTSVSATVPPGSMSRLVIPIRKFILSEEQLSQPIPTLSDRQFVVQKSKLSVHEARTQREFFWYREHLFKCVRGRWREVRGVRSGDLSLRQQRMTLPMLETLRLENAQVQMSLVAYDDSLPTHHPLAERDGKFYPPADQFVYLRTKITNTSPSSQVFTMDLEMEPSEHIIYEGVLTEMAVGRLGSGESREVDTAICFLAYGHFEISAEVRSFDSPRSDTRVGVGQLIAVVEGKTAK